MDQRLRVRQDHMSQQRTAAQARHKCPGTETKSEVAPARHLAGEHGAHGPEAGAEVSLGRRHMCELDGVHRAAVPRLESACKSPGGHIKMHILM